jgi:hypothetical protein
MNLEKWFKEYNFANSVLNFGINYPSNANKFLFCFLELKLINKKIKMAHNIKPGVATGDQVQEIFNYAKEKGFALPAVNVTGSNTINGV